ncbi:putative enoyl-CoA hydratase 1 [Pseudovibrio axinellae]|uniref:Putative enoyl-CoA hydratase 1 n=1 Tax=Pseudovibrio axinellae TaxID=989403 RepID=A0A165XZ19_9HYPH|nr:MaoC family dehydratase [Pseudovibrio axinellae]KZL18259.1 putative enoyl-CoA hydratase 1 [Pseudovibrio axinellae]SER72358.1 Acyl dehydratase [Pseudovibrio axinellae]
MKITLEQLEAKVGQEVGLSDWLVVDQEMISTFGKLTFDEQFIHMDPERAKTETPFGGTIAHGFLTLSLASKFGLETLPDLEGRTMGINYGFDKIRFLHPVVSGKRIRGRFTLESLTRKGEGQVLQELGVSIEIEGVESPALVAKWLTMSIFEEVTA